MLYLTFTECQNVKRIRNVRKMIVLGIIKEIDKLGRIVIPKEYRERFGLSDEIEIVPTDKGILLRSPRHKLVKVDSSPSNDELFI